MAPEVLACYRGAKARKQEQSDKEKTKQVYLLQNKYNKSVDM
jgi:hypothetical protein